MADTSYTNPVHLFDAELIYQDGLTPFTSYGELAGDWVGSGDGVVAGPLLRGTLRWSNYERSTDDHCELTLVGEIATEDGARIQFEARGFALPPAGKTAWNVAAAVRFSTDDARYRWLEPVPAILAGEFDEAEATARYRAYLPAEEAGVA